MTGTNPPARTGARRLLEDHRVKRLKNRLGVPHRVYLPWVIPGAPTVLEWRWRRIVDRAPIVDVEEFCRAVGLKEIEEVIGCSVCGERRCQPLFTRVAPSGKWSYRVVRCPNCTLLYRLPGIRPERLGDLYSGEYDKFLTGHYGGGRLRRYRLVMKAFSPVFKDGRGRRLLDFGSGAGLFMELAQRRGFEPYGVDLSERAVAVARGRPGGANSYFGAPEDIPEIAAGGFDVITLWSVLAHLATPVADLARLRGLLDDDGVLLILTVNAESLALKWELDRWGGFTTNHLKIFSPATLPPLLRRAGFGAVVLKPGYGDPLEAGKTPMRPRDVARVKRVIDQGLRGNMIRALAFVDSDGPAKWGLAGRVERLVP